MQYCVSLQRPDTEEQITDSDKGPTESKREMPVGEADTGVQQACKRKNGKIGNREQERDNDGTERVRRGSEDITKPDPATRGGAHDV